MPRKAAGRNNPSHKRARKRAREQMDREIRNARFHMMAEQNGLIYDSRRGFGVCLDLYEYVLRAIRRGKVDIPRDLLIGSAMGWLYEQILGFQKGEEKRATAREDAETKHEDLLFEAAQKQLHQWVPQPVPDDFVCPYTGDTVDKRKILATGARYKTVNGKTVYDGHESIVVYRTGHRGDWYTARETWDGGRDGQGNRVGVQVEKIPCGEVTVTRKLGREAPGLPWRGVRGYSGQPGRPAVREHLGPSPFADDDIVDSIIEQKSGYKTEADARKQAMLWILSPLIRGEKAEIMGREHVHLRRAARMRGGVRRGVELRASAPAADTPMERLTPTIPPHQWGGEIVEDKAPHIRKERRKVKQAADSDEIRTVISENRRKALYQSNQSNS